MCHERGGPRHVLPTQLLTFDDLLLACADRRPLAEPLSLKAAATDNAG
jgi:hypothetical protein